MAATQTGTHSDASESLDKLGALARERRPDDESFADFIVRYYGELPASDLDERHGDDLYAAAATHFSLGHERAAGQTRVRVFQPDRDRDGWSAPQSVLMFVTDDVPFLIDTVRMALGRTGHSTYGLVHPLLAVERSDDGQIVGIGSGTAEAWTQIEIDACTDDEAREVKTAVAAAIDAVHSSVRDFPTMRDRMAEIADIDPILQWFAEGHFVFLGSAIWRHVDGELVLDPGSVIGQGMDEADPDPHLVPPHGWPDEPGITIARSDSLAAIHRPARQTIVTVGLRDGTVHRYAGLLASSAYQQSVLSIPTVGERARAVLGLAESGAESHAGRSMRNVLETLPRHLLFEVDSDTLARLVIDIVGLQERQVVRVFDVPEPVGNSSTVLVYMPRARYSAQLSEDVAEMVAQQYGSDARDLDTHVGAGSLVRVAFTVRRAPDAEIDLHAIAEQVDAATTSWDEQVRDLLVESVGVAEAHRVMGRLDGSVAPSFKARVPARSATGDLLRVTTLVETKQDLATAISHDIDAPSDEWRFRVYRRNAPLTLAELMPLFDHLGLRALDEHPFKFNIDDDTVYVYDIGVLLPDDVEMDRSRHDEIRATFEDLLTGRIEPDGLNRLVAIAGLNRHQVEVLRAYSRYLQQIGFVFSQAYIEDTLVRLPDSAVQLVELFKARFNPDVADREPMVAEARARTLAQLDQIQTLDDDRVCRMFLSLIEATLRTTAFQAPTGEKPSGTIAFKFDPSKVPDLPAPRPMYEIFVCSPRVEGVHLRGGPIARGGLRWSDRREDFRTEVLGLVKAQMVKNAVIVPVGAKGGFIVKQPPADRAALREAGVACYTEFVSALLDITDNVLAASVVPPSRVVRYDGDDPYLVVAADKGTATFSDLANSVAKAHDFWLDDAFASGGSAGYDHKAMGITARGAWESVRRHARTMGLDADTDAITAVGIGDMAGDVFGNGMLRSSALRLVAAFNHEHIFIDPDPDAAAAFAERTRLFETPGSNWVQYDPAAISEGGGVFSRTEKSIVLSAQAKVALGTDADAVTPIELIKIILTAPVDLFWNGGIGTYVKASHESHADVGDRANDALRINGSDLRCKMIGEGGNLGLTQLGRVEYALAGGLVYTDAIDNSAGVDCSDHEVNIKILLSDVMRRGELTEIQRNALLEQMTAEVAELVLDNNRAQTLALQIARQQSLPMVNVHARYLDQLETEGWIDRSIEFLPTDRELAERQANGSGLRAPEFAVMIAYTKNANVAELLLSDLPDDPALDADILAYFPTELRARYPEAILRHRLRREIGATELINQLVNLSGISYDHRVTEDTGATIVDVARAWLAAREIFRFADEWNEIDALGAAIPFSLHLELFLDCRRAAERCSLWLVRHRHPPLDVAATIAAFRETFAAVTNAFPANVSGPMGQAMASAAATRVVQGVPGDLAERSAGWRISHTAFDTINVAQELGVDPIDVTRVYWQMFERLELMWLWDGIGALPRSDRWQTQARSALRDDLLTVLADLARTVISTGDGTLDGWMSANERSIGRVTQMFTDIRRAESYDLTTLSVALRQLRNLDLTSVRQA